MRLLKSAAKAQASPVPLTVAADSNSTSSIQIKCQDRTVVPSSVQVTSFNGKGKLFQAGSPPSDIPGTAIKVYPAVLTSTVAELMYRAPLNPSLETFNFTCVCSGLSQKGLAVIKVLPPPQADGSLVVTAISGSSKYFYLNGSTRCVGVCVSK